MGIDFGSLFAQAQDAANNAIADAEKTVVPTLVASGEQWGANALADMAKTNQAAATAGATAIAQRPPAPPGSFGAVFSGMVGRIGQTVGGQQFGVPILVGGLALIVVGVLLARR